jgi:YidC/Oxa1 family membrane protein insertase
MTNNIRVFLWLGLALALWLNYSQWQIDYGPKPVTAGTAAANGAADAPKPSGLDEIVPQATQAASPEAAVPAAPGAQTPVPPAAAPAADQTVRVTTDVLVMDISLTGGTLVRAELPAYPLVKGQAAPVVLLNRDDPSTIYTLQTGLADPKGAKNSARPTHTAPFTAEASSYSLAAGQDELRVPLTWKDGNGITVTKTYVFRRSTYAIGLEYQIRNETQAPWDIASYAQINRTDPPVERSMFKVDSYATRGPAIYDPGGRKYRKLKIDDDEDTSLSLDVANGWVAAIQHHFVSAVVPTASLKYHFTMRAAGRQYLLAAIGPGQAVAPGAVANVRESLFVGPKLQKQLDTLHPELSRVADYGVLTFLSKPLFWLLEHAHSFVHNWGLAIILVTFLLKLMFYPLSEKAGRSMARMRALAPRMKILQETYKDDRSKLGQATMELYKTEKVNPVAGCLPMLIQMPVFLAFYWVLLESVEMRQAPFFGWINDLSSRDPYFILPLLNGLAMWGQSKLNPPPPDPMQAKIFALMPIVFSVMFALFPAGLVLYWVTNTGLSILQQWNINRKITLEDKSRKK